MAESSGRGFCTFVTFPEPVGWYRDDQLNIRYAVYRKPGWWNRFWRHVIFGWRYEAEARQRTADGTDGSKA